MAALTLSTHRVYLGTFESGAKGGIYTATFDSQTGALSAATLCAKLDSPSFLVQHPKLPILYAIGNRGGHEVVVGYKIGADGTLTEISHAPIGDGGHCHLAISADGTRIASAAYGSGYVVTLSVNPDGTLGHELWRNQHAGHGPRKDRQEGPHAHSVNFDGQFLLSCDLGADQVLTYDGNGKLLHTAAMTPGYGPRHIAIHPNHKWAYVIHELSGMVTQHAYHSGELGAGTPFNLLEPDFKGVPGAAELEIHRSGKWLIGSNRVGENSLVSFAIDAQGHLKTVDRFLKNVTHPRHFTFDPSGNWVLTGSMDAGEVLVTAFDPGTGHFRGTDQKAVMPHPTCVLFAR